MQGKKAWCQVLSSSRPSSGSSEQCSSERSSIPRLRSALLLSTPLSSSFPFSSSNSLHICLSVCSSGCDSILAAAFPQEKNRTKLKKAQRSLCLFCCSYCLLPTVTKRTGTPICLFCQYLTSRVFSFSFSSITDVMSTLFGWCGMGKEEGMGWTLGFNGISCVLFLVSYLSCS